jgi:glycosyltransferase involved in cell wall biosynthesis
VKLSVVVPAFNEERLLAQTLAHVGAGMEILARRGWSSELIVCDNNSTDRTAEIARAAGARVVFEPVNQISRARNAGAAAASGDWLLFVDADCSPNPALFQDMLERIETQRCVGGGSTVTLPGAPLAVRAWVGGWNAFSRTMKWAAGSFLFCEGAAFRAVGGFSEELYAAEEIDFSRRLKARYQDREFVILHRHPLATSGRKAELYSWREHLAFMWRMLTAGRRTLRSREACSVWYDGRR